MLRALAQQAVARGDHGNDRDASDRVALEIGHLGPEASKSAGYSNNMKEHWVIPETHLHAWEQKRGTKGNGTSEANTFLHMRCTNLHA